MNTIRKGNLVLCINGPNIGKEFKAWQVRPEQNRIILKGISYIYNLNDFIKIPFKLTIK